MFRLAFWLVLPTLPMFLIDLAVFHEGTPTSRTWNCSAPSCLNSTLLMSRCRHGCRCRTISDSPGQPEANEPSLKTHEFLAP